MANFLVKNAGTPDPSAGEYLFYSPGLWVVDITKAINPANPKVPVTFGLDPGTTAAAGPHKPSGLNGWQGGSDVTNMLGRIVCSKVSGFEMTQEHSPVIESGSRTPIGVISHKKTYGPITLTRHMSYHNTNFTFENQFFKLAQAGYIVDIELGVFTSETADQPIFTYAAYGCIPTKYKPADLDVNSTEAAIEELELAPTYWELITSP